VDPITFGYTLFEVCFEHFIHFIQKIMTIKKSISILFLCLCSMWLSAQEHAHAELLKTPENWGKEVFEFPLSFAQDIPYSGYEEARFPVGWGKQDSSMFWTYAFAWHIDVSKPVSAHDLEINLQHYFDGLMRLRSPEDAPGTFYSTALFLPQKASRFIGKVKTVDQFFTKKSMLLYATVDVRYCKNKKQALLLFRFSPQAFDSPVWKRLEQVKFLPGGCP
jgi:hypothetical protein